MSKATELTKRIAEHIEHLAQLTDDARKSEAMQTYLDMLARFRHYSYGNLMLIAFQRPDATQIAGYRTWRAVGRQVRRGERGIAILAPMYIRVKGDSDEDDEGMRKPAFKTVHVFDVSQTEGEPLAREPQWTSPETNHELAGCLHRFADSLNITITTADIEAQGESHGGAIVLRPEAGTKTLIHEIAHELLHRQADRDEISRQVREIEAEAAAYVVAKVFNFKELNSPNYLALWNADSDQIRDRFDRIQKCAVQIIEACISESESSE